MHPCVDAGSPTPPHSHGRRRCGRTQAPVETVDNRFLSRLNVPVRPPALWNEITARTLAAHYGHDRIYRGFPADSRQCLVARYDVGHLARRRLRAYWRTPASRPRNTRLRALRRTQHVRRSDRRRAYRLLPPPIDPSSIAHACIGLEHLERELLQSALPDRSRDPP